MGQSIKSVIALLIRQKGNLTVIAATAVVAVLMLHGYADSWGEADVRMAAGIAQVGVIAIIATAVRKDALRLGVVDALVAVAAFYALMNAVMLSSPYPIASLAVQTALMLCLYFFLRITTNRSYNFITIAIITIGSIEAVIALLQLFGLFGHTAIRGQMTGTFQNPGPLGIFLAVAIATGIAHYRKTHNQWLLIPIVLMLTLLPSTFSRAALLSLAVSLAIIFRDTIRRYWIVVLIAVIMACGTLYIFKQGSADCRTLMGLIAMRQWLAAPWFGHGIGSYIPMLADGQINFFASAPESDFAHCVGTADRAFCEYLRTAVEQGAVGLILQLAILSTALYRLLRQRSPLAYALITLYVAAAFSYPFHLQQFCLLLVLILSGTATPTTTNTLRLSARLLILFVTAALTTTTYLLMTYTAHRANESREAATFMHMQDTCFIDDYYEMLPTMTDNRDFLFNFAMTLRKAGRYNDSNAMLRRGTQLDTDPMPIVLMGRNYEDMVLRSKNRAALGLPDSLYRRAFLLQPNRIYPLYRQMKLYEAMGDSVRLKAKAREVAGFKPKVDSPAVRDMKKEANVLIKNMQ